MSLRRKARRVAAKKASPAKPTVTDVVAGQRSMQVPVGVASVTTEGVSDFIKHLPLGSTNKSLQAARRASA